MEFWGVEVKAGEKLKVKPDDGKLIHISQAAMGEVKDVKGAKNVPLRMRIDDKNFVIGSLSAEDRTQVMFDLVFEKDFELSHDLKNGSVYFIGYIADDPVSDGEVYSDFDSESEDDVLPIEAKENGTLKAKAKDVKPAAKAKNEHKVAKKEEENSDDDEVDSDFDSDDEMALGLDEDSSNVSGDDSDEEDEDDSSEEELPKEKPSKKRQALSAEKTPAAKKAKSATPDKTGKKGQNSTPFPVKSAGKTPNKSKEQTPKSGGQLSCKSCPKTFSSENALESHSKAKHGSK